MGEAWVSGVREELGLVCCSPRGEVALHGMTALAAELAKAVARRSARGVLIDCAGLHGSLPVGELFEVGQVFARELRKVRLAAFNAPSEWHDNRFSENVIANRGGILRHFPNEADARAWLSEVDSPGSDAP